MRVILLFFLLANYMMVDASEYCSTCIDENSITATDQSGKYVAFYKKEKGCIFLMDFSGNNKSYYIDGTEKIEDVPLNLEMSFSNDSKYLMVSFSASEYDRIAQVIDLKSNQVIFEKSVDFAVWSGIDNNLILVPKSNADYEPTTKGLILYSPAKDETKIIAGEYFFTSNIHASGGIVIADVALRDEVAGTHSVKKIYYNLSTNKSQWLDDKTNFGKPISLRKK